MPTFICPDCLKRFANRQSWLNHMKTCTAPKAR